MGIKTREEVLAKGQAPGGRRDLRWDSFPWARIDKKIEDAISSGVTPTIDLVIDTTFNDLLALQNANNLEEGVWYRFEHATSFELNKLGTFYTSPTTETVMLLATSSNTLSEDALSIDHPEDYIKYNFAQEFITAQWSVSQFWDGASFISDFQQNVTINNLVGNTIDFTLPGPLDYNAPFSFSLFELGTFEQWNINQPSWNDAITNGDIAVVDNGGNNYTLSILAVSFGGGLTLDWSSLQTNGYFWDWFDSQYAAGIKNGVIYHRHDTARNILVTSDGDKTKTADFRAYVQPLWNANTVFLGVSGNDYVSPYNFDYQITVNVAVSGTVDVMQLNRVSPTDYELRPLLQSSINTVRNIKITGALEWRSISFFGPVVEDIIIGKETDDLVVGGFFRWTHADWAFFNGVYYNGMDAVYMRPGASVNNVTGMRHINAVIEGAHESCVMTPGTMVGLEIAPNASLSNGAFDSVGFMTNIKILSGWLTNFHFGGMSEGITNMTVKGRQFSNIAWVNTRRIENFDLEIGNSSSFGVGTGIIFRGLDVKGTRIIGRLGFQNVDITNLFNADINVSNINDVTISGGLIDTYIIGRSLSRVNIGTMDQCDIRGGMTDVSGDYMEWVKSVGALVEVLFNDMTTVKFLNDCQFVQFNGSLEDITFHHVFQSVTITNSHNDQEVYGSDGVNYKATVSGGPEFTAAGAWQNLINFT